jgi:hypothetical protein
MRSTRHLLLVCALLAAPAAEGKSGLYLGFHLGGAIVSGDAPITFPQSEINKDLDFGKGGNTQVLFSTDVGGGFATGFHIGYNILGFVAIEANFNASGNGLGAGDSIEGQGGVAGLLRFFPAQLFAEPDRWWDPYVTLGGGVHFMGYNPEAHADGSPMIIDGRAWWPGFTFNWGLGSDFYVVPFFSVGIDLMFVHAYHDEFHIDNAENVVAIPTETATAFIFVPTVKLDFHFF